MIGVFYYAKSTRKKAKKRSKEKGIKQKKIGGLCVWYIEEHRMETEKRKELNKYLQFFYNIHHGFIDTYFKFWELLKRLKFWESGGDPFPCQQKKDKND